ncbi:POK9 protein, partial [Cercotrichas coryphoeus]|nr:POK9 protein [Cercotrichas coryphoeus]
RGSLGLDLAAAIDIVLKDTKPVKIPTGVHGPLILNGQSYGALLLGRSSTTLQGLTVEPGVIDAGYTGEIMIMAHTRFPPISIPAGSRIAQLVPLPQLVKEARGPLRGTGRFGSTGGLVLLTLTMEQRPVVEAILCFAHQEKRLRALLDTGADITIIA